MSYTFWGGYSPTIVVEWNITTACSPLVTFSLSMKHDMSLEIRVLTDILLWGAPIIISVGCRLILSVREAASSHHITSVSGTSHTMGAFVVQDQLRGEDSCII